MIRRSFVLKSALAVGLGLVSSNKVFAEAYISYPSRVTTIYFPIGKKFTDFQNDLGLWMDVEKWRSFLEAQKKSGALIHIHRLVRSNSVAYIYKFRSPSDLDRFEVAAHLICNVNLNARNNLGYRNNISFS